jgi:predicted transposase YbfD/YdcC
MSSAPTASLERPRSLRECFQDFNDPRREHGRLHTLGDIIGLTICATICGCDEVTQIEKYGHAKMDFLRTFLDLDNGIPSHDTIGRVFGVLDPKKFRDCFSTWVESLAQSVHGRHIAIDGKTLRSAYQKGEKPLHLVSAFAADNRLVLTQQAVHEKSNEITAIPELLSRLDVKKAVVTIDAMGCQKEIAAQIQEQGGDYVLSWKENQPNLHAKVKEIFQKGFEDDCAGMKHQEWETTDTKCHGRVETRTYRMIQPSKEWLAMHPEWKGLKTLGMVESERQEDGKPATGETRFFISSMSLNVSRFAEVVRGHWSIENQLHWILDISFCEDQNRSRKDHTPENLAWIRRVTASMLAQYEANVGIKCKRKMAGWNDEVLLEIAGQAIA